MIFHADSEADLKTSPNQVKNPILLKIRFLEKFEAAASAEGLLNHKAFTEFSTRAIDLKLDDCQLLRAM